MTSGTNPILDWNDQTFPWSDSGLSPKGDGVGLFNMVVEGFQVPRDLSLKLMCKHLSVSTGIHFVTSCYPKKLMHSSPISRSKLF